MFLDFAPILWVIAGIWIVFFSLLIAGLFFGVKAILKYVGDHRFLARMGEVRRHHGLYLKARTS